MGMRGETSDPSAAHLADAVIEGRAAVAALADFPAEGRFIEVGGGVDIQSGNDEIADFAVAEGGLHAFEDSSTSGGNSGALGIVQEGMRWLGLWMAAGLLSGCGPRLTFHPAAATQDELLGRASLVFIGVIESEELEYQLPFRLFWRVDSPPPAEEGDYWRILRRRVRVETVLRSEERRPLVDVYEIFWLGGATGKWNDTQIGERAIFLVRPENGQLHVVQDWVRCIYSVSYGARRNVPLDESRPLWERIALLYYWIDPAEAESKPYNTPWGIQDPGNVLSEWRKAKLWRGLLRHPARNVRLMGCNALIRMGNGQDECWDAMSEAERRDLQPTEVKPTETLVQEERQRDAKWDPAWMWKTYSSVDDRRLQTAHSNPRIRQAACALWAREYPTDPDNGCPADRPPPATVVRAQGEVPIL
jgi:hypothetical protein